MFEKKKSDGKHMRDAKKITAAAKAEVCECK